MWSGGVDCGCVGPVFEEMGHITLGAVGVVIIVDWTGVMMRFIHHQVKGEKKQHIKQNVS